MNAIELFLHPGSDSGLVSSGIWACGACRLVALDKARAESCCDRRCSNCNAPLIEHSYSVCPPCRDLLEEKREKERFEKAEKVTEWDGCVYLDGEYYPDIDTFHEMCDDGDLDASEYVWTCDEHHFVRVDSGDITERFADEAYDDWDPESLHGLDELEIALKAFVEANKDQVAYEVNYKRALLLPKREPIEDEED